jgi:DNA-binding response OmpR family regulator
MIFRRKQTPEAVKPETPARVTTPVSVTAPRSTVPGKKILVVDDDPTTLQALAYKLKSRGFEVVTAADASEALNVTRKERPDLMLLDVNLPPDVGSVDWNGFLVTQWLQRMEEGKNIPVIVMSASDRPEYKERALFSGATAFFCKLTDNDQMFASIDSALRANTVTRPAKPNQVFEI